MTGKDTLNRPQNSLWHQILVMHYRIEISKIIAERTSPVLFHHSSFETYYLTNDDVGSLLAMSNYSHSMTGFTDKCLKCDCGLLLIKDRPICFQCQISGIQCWYSAVKTSTCHLCRDYLQVHCEDLKVSFGDGGSRNTWYHKMELPADRSLHWLPTESCQDLQKIMSLKDITALCDHTKTSSWRLTLKLYPVFLVVVDMNGSLKM